MHKTKRHRPKNVWPKRDPEVHASVVFLLAEFMNDASEDDFSLLAQTLADWSENPEVNGWFTYCSMKVLGMPVLPINGGKSPSLAKLRKQALTYPIHQRERFVAEHLDLITSDASERAFLVTCQKIYREIGDTPGYRIPEVAPKITDMAQLLLEESMQVGAKAVSGHTRRKARAPRQFTTRTRKPRLAAA